jgi:hypothetical protein
MPSIWFYNRPFIVRYTSPAHSNAPMARSPCSALPSGYDFDGIDGADESPFQTNDTMSKSEQIAGQTYALGECQHAVQAALNKGSEPFTLSRHQTRLILR